MKNGLTKIAIAAGAGAATLAAVILGTAVGNQASPLTVLADHWQIQAPAVGIATAVAFALLELNSRRTRRRTQEKATAEDQTNSDKPSASATS